MFELSGDDERDNHAEALEHNTEWLIEQIFEAADEFGALPLNAPMERLKAVDNKLSKAIDAAMSHAYAEGRADQLRDMREAELEKAARAMNETGQGEHLHPVFAEILNHIGGKRAA
jgi:hypothetical protein